jgi:hypothetical protein
MRKKSKKGPGYMQHLKAEKITESEVRAHNLALKETVKK